MYVYNATHGIYMVYTVVVFSRQLFYLFLVREQSLAIESSKNAEKLRELTKVDFIHRRRGKGALNPSRDMK